MSALGDRSYALYLVNDPVAVTLAAGIAGSVGFAARLPGDAILIASAILVSLALTEVAHRLVEQPCMALARRLRHAVTRSGAVLRAAA